jgi:hypothetical protein
MAVDGWSEQARWVPHEILTEALPACELMDRVFDVKQVRATIANQDTGTTFLLTGRGLYLIRPPAAESEKKRRDEEWFWQHNGN